MQVVQGSQDLHEKLFDGRRAFGNILIAAGALSPAMGGSLLKAGLVDMLYLSEFVGAILMYIGFMMSTSGKSEPAVSE